MSFEFAIHCDCGTTGWGRENGGLLCSSIFKILSTANKSRGVETTLKNVLVCTMLLLT